MAKYILKRVLQFIPVFIGVTMILFAMKAIVPGDPIQVITGGKQVTPETELQLRIANGFIEVDDQGKPLYDENGDTIPTPIWKQYLTYMNDLLHGDLGTSYTRNMKVSDIFAQKYPYTVKLAIVAICLEAVVGIGAGMVSAIKRYSFWDVLVTLVTSVLVAMPAFWLGMLLQLFFGVVLKNATDGAFYLPISGAGGSNSDFQDWVHYILPAITLASVSTAYAARIMRSQLLEVMNQDYIRTAKAKGLSRRDIIWHHALKNALIPVVTYIGIDFGAMLAGAILTETVFNWPGVGYEIYRAVTARDWPIVMGGVTVIVIVVMLINLLVDISYAFLDPRIRYGAPKDEG
ncbi:ABC transporter permease [uncultured Parolsenella sp.]|uniref:ABC transporter permease n=1 Tax=uncultured Parolsenella sp. TaxID=2083008 RepID=UPI0025DA21A6|nr:ABC transporter permease [uncultured Parolsenella sp.]